MLRKTLMILSFALTTLVLDACSSNHLLLGTGSSPIVNANALTNPSSLLEDPSFWQNNPATIWTNLQQISLTKLAQLETTTDANIRGWVSLAIISKRYSIDLATLTKALMAWRHLYPDHTANNLFPSDTILTALANQNPPANIALLLPLSGKFAAQGKEVRDGFMQAYQQQLKLHPSTQTITYYDTNITSDIGSLYEQALSHGANFVIGPLTKDDVRTLAAKTNLSVPTLSLNYLAANESIPVNLYQFGLSPQDEAKQITDKARSAGLSHALIIAPQNFWGQNLASSVSSQWHKNGGIVTDTYYFPDNANFENEFTKLTANYDVIFLLAPAASARQIVPVIRAHGNNQIPIYATSAVYTGVSSPTQDKELDGVIFCDAPSLIMHNASSRLTAVGQDAYRLSYNLSRFIEMPSFPLYGATGSLHLNNQHQFYRRLAWAQFHNGNL